MHARKTIIGVCLLCAFAFSAVAAQSAFAIEGTTAFTCASTPGTGTFPTDHCKPVESGTGTAFSHVAIAQDTTTEITGTNAKTNATTTEAEKTILKSQLSGVETEIEATGVHGEGWMENKLDASGEHYVHGEGVITYTGAKLLKPQPAKCKLEKTEYSTKQLTATTTGAGMGLTFTPVTPETFIEFTIVKVGAEACPVAGTYKVTGSVTGEPEGATTVFKHGKVGPPAEGTTGQNTLKLGGNRAGVEGKLTISGRVKGSGAAYTPLSATTVVT